MYSHIDINYLIYSSDGLRRSARLHQAESDHASPVPDASHVPDAPPVPDASPVPCNSHEDVVWYVCVINLFIVQILQNNLYSMKNLPRAFIILLDN